jgi:hypothetical protein
MSGLLEGGHGCTECRAYDELARELIRASSCRLSDPSSPEFQAAYHAALRGEATKQALAIVATRGGSGSVKDAIDRRYLDSTTFPEVLLHLQAPDKLQPR